MFSSDPCDFSMIIRIELLNVSNDFATIRNDGSKEQEILKVLVLAEWGWLQDDLFQEFNQFHRKICGAEGLDSDGYIICVCALGDGGSDNLGPK